MNGKVLNFNGLKDCKWNFGHFSSKYAGISLFQFDITELFNIELMGVIFGAEGGLQNKR